MNVHEEEFARNFVVKSKRERTAMLLGNAKRRAEFTKSLAHYGDLDPVSTRVVTPKEAHSAEEWVRLLTSKGAPPKCWIISENPKLDGSEVELEKAMSETLGQGWGTLLSCVAGKLCYFENEDGQWLLER